MSATLLEVKNLNKTFYSDWGKVEALKQINFTCSKGEFITIVGSSGCGKTTLLRIIAGLEEPSTGEVIFEGKRVRGPGHERAVVFQEPRLFPWLNVEQNISIGILDKKDRSIVKQIVDETLHLVGLTAFRKAYPYELSGGMAQRVAIARAFAFEPKVLLMDEPFSALDAQSRSRLQMEMLELWKEIGKTVLLVTHDIDEAIILGQKILIMSPSPGTIRKIVEIPMTYPRNKDSAEFSDLKKLILESML